MKYRVKEIKWKNGSSSFQVQSFLLFRWIDCDPPMGTRCYGTLKEAKSEIEVLKGRAKCGTKHHY